MASVRSAVPSITTNGALLIAFHNMKPSAALRADIKKRAAKLEKLYGRLIACRVSVEALHRQHRTGNIHEVHIEIDAPGKRIVVSHEPHHASERRRRLSARDSIHDAFKTAEAQLKHFKDQRKQARPKPRVAAEARR